MSAWYWEDLIFSFRAMEKMSLTESLIWQSLIYSPNLLSWPSSTETNSKKEFSSKQGFLTVATFWKKLNTESCRTCMPMDFCGTPLRIGQLSPTSRRYSSQNWSNVTRTGRSKNELSRPSLAIRCIANAFAWYLMPYIAQICARKKTSRKYIHGHARSLWVPFDTDGKTNNLYWKNYW